MASLDVHFLPQHVAPEQLVGSTCVVIDVLRATTTIAFALEAGAKEIIPCLEVDDAYQIATTLPTGTYLLGGERGGKKIDGFDLGNSPTEYHKDRVKNKTLVFTTTNGTRAILHCRQANEVLLGSLANAYAIAEQLATREKVNLVCAGTDGEITREDVLAAGAVVMLTTSISREFNCNDEALIAADAWQSIFSTATLIPGAVTFENYLAGMLRDCRGGRNLIEIGLERDLGAAADLSALSTVPIFRDGRITRLGVETS